MPRPELPDLLAELARCLSPSLLRQVAARLEALPAPDAQALESLAVTTQARAHLKELHRQWSQAEVSPLALALGLRAALATQEWCETHERAELVWTGPTSLQTDWRRTEQVLLHLIDAAQHTLWLVTFAAFRVPSVAQGLARAAERGVQIFFVAESAEASEGRIARDAFEALSADLPRQTQTLIWPRAKRPVDHQGHYGTLHAKCAVADDTLALISSANLTGHALQLNIEAGVLLRGEAAARMAAMLRDQLQNGIFVPLTDLPRTKNLEA